MRPGIEPGKEEEDDDRAGGGGGGGRMRHLWSFYSKHSLAIVLPLESRRRPIEKYPTTRCYAKRCNHGALNTFGGVQRQCTHKAHEFMTIAFASSIIYDER